MVSKEYLLACFNNDKYIDKSLIYIYVHDKEYYDELYIEGKVDSGARCFLEQYRFKLREIANNTPNASRLLEYENLINEYNSKNKGGLINDYKDVYINLLCPADKTRMRLTKLIKIKLHNSKKRIMPVYICPKCKANYTSVSCYSEKCKIHLEEDVYINLLPIYNSADYKKASSIQVRRLIKGRFYIYDNRKNEKRKNCRNSSCNNNKLKTVSVLFKSKKNKKNIQAVKWCDICKTYYAPYFLTEQFDFPYEIVNEKEVLEIKRERKQQVEEGSDIIKEHPKDNLPSIEAKDFVVRRSIFRCMHNDHSIDDILAWIEVIGKNGNIHYTKVSAGYCATCSIYFILESTYDNLKKQGIPICRISDEKNYLKSGNVGGMMLANESILMQYGYNVGQKEDLSVKTRHKILATLIDRHILRKSEIISYLDFFISQRQSRDMYRLAIAKWELDRDFVESYKEGKYQEVGVKGLYR